MSELVKIAERWRGAYSVWTRSDMQGHEVVTSTAAKLVEELSAAEAALADAKEENERLKAPVSNKEWKKAAFTVEDTLVAIREDVNALIEALSKAPGGAQKESK